jgi:hypothetical protein
MVIAVKGQRLLSPAAVGEVVTVQPADDTPAPPGDSADRMRFGV